jgi:hypothetical protein
MQGSVLKQCWNYRPSGAENRHMRDRENLDKSMSFDEKGASTYSPAEKTQENKMADSDFSLYPWCIWTYPSPGICPVKGSQFLSIV